MALTQGSPLPDVTTTTSQVTQAPDYYTNYLSNLAQAGTTATGMDPSKMVAGFSNLQQQGFGMVPGAATAYQPQLTAAGQTAATAAGGITPGAIQSLMNPYTQSVVDEMARLSNQNVQRNVLPGLKAAFGSTGGFGSKRFADVSGQTLADIQSGLTGKQSEALRAGYSDALTAALSEQQLRNAVAQTQGALAGKEQELGLAGARGLLDAGALQQAYDQARIEAPLKQATNAAALLRGYNIPTTVNQRYTGPMPGAYSSSPLQTIVGLGSLFASSGSGKSAASGVADFLSGLLSKGGGSSGSSSPYTYNFNDYIDTSGGGTYFRPPTYNTDSSNLDSSSYWTGGNRRTQGD
jgi:hypothetical protein